LALTYEDRPERSHVPRTRLGVAVVGGGFAGRAHIEAARRTGAARSLALAVRAPEGRHDAVDTVTGDYRQLLEDDSIDVVHNCLPNALHAEVTAAALEAGKHVISEKPLAVTGAEADELQRLADASGLVNAVCFNYRFYPLVRELRARVAAGDIGRPILVHGGYLQDWLLRQGDYNWRVETARGGRSRAVADIGSHWVDLVSYVLDSPVVDVHAGLGRVHDQRRRPAVDTATFARSDSPDELVDVETEDWATLLLRLENGATAQAVVSQVSAGSKNNLRLQVDGTAAALRWEQERPEELWIGRRGAANELLLKDSELLAPDAAGHAALPGGHPEGWNDALTKLVASVYRTILEGAEPDFPTFTDGVNGVRFVEAALASDESGCWQPVRTERKAA
jgi:predicted dehydrogenase